MAAEEEAAREAAEAEAERRQSEKAAAAEARWANEVARTAPAVGDRLSRALQEWTSSEVLA
jgi:hypothetical protein